MGKIGVSNSKKFCSVPQCKSRGTSEVSLYALPKEFSLRKRWADAIKIEKGTTQNTQICSRHFVKTDFFISDGPNATKVRKLKKSAVPTQNLPWQFPNKRVSPTLAKARMERLKNRSQQKGDSPDKMDTGTAVKKTENEKSKPKTKSPSIKDEDSDGYVTSVENISVVLKLEADDVSDVKVETPDDNDIVPETEVPEAKKDSNTQSNAPTRLRNRKGVLKCEFCGRKCLTPQALQTHQQIAHKNARNNQFNIKNTSPVNKLVKIAPKPPTAPLISVKKTEDLQEPKVVNKNKSLEKSLNQSELVERVLQEDEDLGTASDSSESTGKAKGKQDKSKTEFECPKCRRRFAVYFMAYKHIEKHHSTMPNGNKVPNSLLLKPARVEICTICGITLTSNIHLCGGPLKLSHGFICSGCDLEYKTLTLFDMHKSSMHSDGVESMFFSTLDEFQEWKLKMEEQTRTRYCILDQNDTKKIHRCTHRSIVGAGLASKHRMCPSSVVVQEFTKGFQVHYYPIHFEHDFKQYNLGNDFKQYSISSLMTQMAKQLPDSDEEVQKETDLYLQLKKLIDLLVNEAARINVNGLKKLMRKALEMIAIVNSYVEDDDDDMSSSVIKLDSEKDDLQDQVKKALMSLKRKPAEAADETPSKKKKPVFQSTENTLKNKRNDDIQISNSFSINDEIENVKKKVEPKASTPKLNQSLKNQSPSFLGTYEDFVGKNFEKSTEKKKPQEVKKKIVKTKVGQFKPSPPKKASSPPPKKTPNSESPRLSVGSVKEIKYEVKEQENDCNILILKI